MAIDSEETFLVEIFSQLLWVIFLLNTEEFIVFMVVKLISQLSKVKS